MPRIRLATFSVDITPPLAHPLCGGWITPVETVADRLTARGLVLLGDDDPIVLCALDWCELRNVSHDFWVATLAAAAQTVPDRVLVATVHQHDAPLMDDAAQRYLAERRAAQAICDVEFNHRAARRTGAALREAVDRAELVDILGVGVSPVVEVASNRRLLDDEGQFQAVRFSACHDPALRAAPEGLIDPLLRTLSFWQGDRPLAVIHHYAVHPMSRYGYGAVSHDFCGQAREAFQGDVGAPTIYLTGCAGNISAGKYNDGSLESRQRLAQRLQAGMRAAWAATAQVSLTRLELRVERLQLEPKRVPGFFRADFRRLLADPDTRHASRARAAMALSWLERAEEGHLMRVPAIDFGEAQLVKLPGEPFVEYQLAAQAAHPDQQILVIGYGDCGPGYLPTDEAYRQGGYEPGEWCFVAPGTEARLSAALERALRR